jgi:hypothetical protein
MNIDKNQIIDLLKQQGHPQADQAAQELPEQVDTDSTDHQDLLSKLNINTGDITSKLGDLGNIL